MEIESISSSKMIKDTLLDGWHQLKVQLSLGGQVPCKNQGTPRYLYFCFKDVVTFKCIWFVVFCYRKNRKDDYKYAYFGKWLGI